MASLPHTLEVASLAVAAGSAAVWLRERFRRRDDVPPDLPRRATWRSVAAPPPLESPLAEQPVARLTVLDLERAEIYADPIDGTPFEDGEEILLCVCGTAYRPETEDWLQQHGEGACVQCRRALSLTRYVAVSEKSARLRRRD